MDDDNGSNNDVNDETDKNNEKIMNKYGEECKEGTR